MFQGAIVGLGNVALQGHLPAWRKRPGFKILAGVDSSAERRKLFAQALPGAAAFSSLDECRDLALDFVDICTPPHTHFALAQQALERGLHVLCEKPLVLHEQELDELVRLAREKNRLLMTVHNWKYAPICRKIEEVLRSGAIGRPRHCAWYVLRNGPAITTDPDNWRLDPEKAGGGILIDHGWHAFYLVLGWLDKTPLRVQASLENRQYESLPVEDTAKVKLEFETSDDQPLTAEVFLTWASRLRRNWGVVEGSEGLLQMEDDLLKVSKNAPSREAPQEYRFPQALSAGSHHPDWFEQVIAEFESELMDEGRRGRNLRMAQACLGLIERSKESSGKGARVAFA